MTEPRRPVEDREVRAVRPGHGANCSSIGSVVDTLFVTALVGGAVFAAVVGALGREPIEVVGKTPDAPPAPDKPKDSPEPSSSEEPPA
jgi:hypothetical protein